MSKKTENTLSHLYGKKELSDSFIRFQIDLSEIIKKYIEKIKTPDIAIPDESLTKQKLENGSPLITFVPVSLPQEILISCWKDLIKVFHSHKILSADFSSKVKSNSDAKLVKGIIRAVTSFDYKALEKLADHIPMDHPTLNLISRELVKPFFHSLSNHILKSVSLEHWSAGFCPVCGDFPGFARFSKDEEGKRYLWCERCDIEWGFQRVCCPFCNNSDHKKLKFLTTNHREELRIDVCENCKGYIKTLDQRKIEGEEEKKIDYLKESVASLFMDMVAEENGFTIQIPTIQQTEIIFDSDDNFH